MEASAALSPCTMRAYLSPVFLVLCHHSSFLASRTRGPPAESGVGRGVFRPRSADSTMTCFHRREMYSCFLCAGPAASGLFVSVL